MSQYLGCKQKYATYTNCHSHQEVFRITSDVKLTDTVLSNGNRTLLAELSRDSLKNSVNYSPP